MNQKPGENVETFIAKFKSARDICKTRLPEGEFVRLAIENLKPRLRMHFISQQFANLCHLIEVMSRCC